MSRLIAAFLLACISALPARTETEIEEVVSKGGITAWLVQESSIPFVALELRFRGGASLDASGKRGAINLMTGLLEEGAGDLDSRSFTEAQERLASSFSYRAGPDSLSVSAKFLTENRDEAVALLRLSLVEPTFEQVALDRVREQVLSSLRSDAKDPDQIARAAFDEMAFGDHPYSTQFKGTLDSVSLLTRDDVVEAHKAVFAKDRIYVGVVGDISPEELGPLLDKLLGDLPEVGAPQPDSADIMIKGGTTVIPFETPQSVTIFGHGGIDQKDPDFFAARLLNHILGAGGFESRLMQEVREKRGLTYGVYSYLVSQDHAATIQGQVASANNKIAEAVSVIRDEWERAATDGVTQAELDAAKTFVTGSYPLRFDGNGPIARIMVGMQMVGLPIDYIPTRNAMVEAVTLEDVQRVAKELLRTEDLHFVVVGKPLGLDETIQN